MKRIIPPALILPFVLGVLAVGLPYWRIPYGEVSLPDALLQWGLVVVVLGAALARALAGTRPMVTVALVGAAVPVVVLARIVVEAMGDPTSHNLAGIEMFIALGLGAAAAGAGVLVGSLWRALRPA